MCVYIHVCVLYACVSEHMLASRSRSQSRSGSQSWSRSRSQSRPWSQSWWSIVLFTCLKVITETTYTHAHSKLYRDAHQQVIPTQWVRTQAFWLSTFLTEREREREIILFITLRKTSVPSLMTWFLTSLPCKSLLCTNTYAQTHARTTKKNVPWYKPFLRS